MLKANTFQMPILTYHHVSNDIDYYTAISPSAFFSQLEFLLEEFECVSLETAFNMYVNKTQSQQKFVLTFDDGYRDNIPVLEYLASHGISASIFLPTATIGKDNKWNHKATYVTPILTQDDIAYIADLGHTFGSHGRTHQCLTKLSDMDLIEEVIGSKEELKKIVPEQQNIFFAYPFGFYDSRVQELVKQNFTAAFATEKTAKNREWNDLFGIYRLTVGQDTTIDMIRNYLYASK